MCSLFVYVCVVALYSCRSNRQETCLVVSDMIQVFVGRADEMQPQLDFPPSTEALLLTEPWDHDHLQETAFYLDSHQTAAMSGPKT